MNAYLLAVLALLMIFLEFFLPGGILGAIGGLILLWSYFTLIQEGASALEVGLFIAGTLVLLGGLIRFALWKIPKDKRGIYLGGDQEGYRSAKYDAEAIGKVGEAQTDLRPGGFIVVEGKRHAAISLSGYIDKGSQVKVISGEGESLMVKRKDN
ncbi:MAG: serine protease [Chlamydiia bacterium]|nr:serine protease [Chlamydiia bacterium]